MVATRLDRLLQRVEMQNKRVGLQHVDGAARAVRAKARHQLHRADIRQQRYVRRTPPEVRRQPPAGAALQRDSLRADRQGDLQLLRRLGQPLIDEAGPLRTAGHGADEQGGCQAPPKEARGEIDRIHVDLRQGHMLEPDGRQAAGALRHRPRPRQDKVDMVVLAVTDVAPVSVHHAIVSLPFAPRFRSARKGAYNRVSRTR